MIPTYSLGGNPPWANHSNCNLQMRENYDHDEGLSWHLTVMHVRIHVGERSGKHNNHFLSQYSARRNDNPGYLHVLDGRQKQGTTDFPEWMSTIYAIS